MNLSGLLNELMFCVQKLEASVQKEIDTKIEEARADPEPLVESTYTHVYKEMPRNFQIRGSDSVLHDVPCE